ncbi:MAG: GntR family transcriptional regulator [Robiginitomaculum sp.]|nr:GntR family transcriptional regulator [Robiginitomaculum sp.]
MEITIDIDGDIPMFTQLIVQIKQAVQSGAIKPGDALPSIRQLAADLQVNNKTIAKAYRLLERDAVIQTKGYRGTFIHPDAKANSIVDLTGWMSRHLSEMIEKYKTAGVTDSEIRIAFGDVMNGRIATPNQKQGE